jgi:subtilisin family serine protease
VQVGWLKMTPLSCILLGLGAAFAVRMIVCSPVETPEQLLQGAPGQTGTRAADAGRGQTGTRRGATVIPDGIVRTTQTGASSYFPLQWGLDRMDQTNLLLDCLFAPPATRGAGAHIFIIDTGINRAHSKFAGGRLGDGYDFVDDDANPEDACNGHGTQIACIAAGATVGVTAEAILHSVRVLDCLGLGLFSDVLAGIELALNHPASKKVATLSFSAGDTIDELFEALSAQQDLPTVASAGSLGDDACFEVPAGTPGYFTVGSSEETDAATYNTNTGSCVGRPVCARVGHPLGVDLRPLQLCKAERHGTSMAAPHAAGAAAAILAASAGALSPTELQYGRS